jgi:cytochrome c oxidase assembly protein subunit 15
MIIIQVLLGGITRLTGSGLSITEWKPIMGALPPLNEAEWQQSFEGYKQIAQYKYLNSHFSLEDYKFIFFWEWFHRLWARLLGVVFAIGFIYFLVRKYFDREMIIPFIILFLLGAAQGLIGWIMVASGLNDSDLYVNHIKLAMHLIAALLLLVYTLWFALQLIVPERSKVASKPLYQFTIFFIAVLSLQLVYGAFMAGLKAAPYAPTWPDMNGFFVPDTFLTKSWLNDPMNVQFIHRLLAYLLTIISIWWFIRSRKIASGSRLFAIARIFPLVLVLLQVLLGVYTVLRAPKMGTSAFGSYELLAQAHQLVAMFLLVALVVSMFLLGKRPSRQRPVETKIVPV